MSFKSAEVGKVPTSWYVEELRFFLDLITYGFTNPMPDANEGPWKLTAKDVIDGRINYTSARRTTSEAYNNSLTDKSRPKVGDVLLTKDGSIGRVAVVDREGVCINQSVALLRPNKLITPSFLKYLLISPHYQRIMEGDSDGSTIKHIYITRVDKMQVAVPPLPEQKGILQIVGSIDDRITLLRETNATLEAIAQALFKSWFVDFDPVRAKQQGREPEGMDAETAALFPDSFEESEQGLVPSGWQVTTLSDAFEINPTRTLKKGSIAPYLDMAKLATSGHCVETPIQREMGSGAKFRNGDTLLARITPCLENGKSAFVDFLADDQIGWGSTEFLVLRPKKPLPEYFGYLLCRHSVFREYAIQSMSGTSGRQRIQNDVLGRFLLALPDDGAASAFTEIVDSIQRSIAGNHETAQTLATLRDTLLPRLISGQLRLPDAEAHLNEAS
jgi:type I restriction enzyme S subunit